MTPELKTCAAKMGLALWGLALGCPTEWVSVALSPLSISQPRHLQSTDWQECHTTQKEPRQPWSPLCLQFHPEVLSINDLKTEGHLVTLQALCPAYYRAQQLRTQD